mmetsp:Transcript_46440/g.54266  ORF Transcript_46440/g.54266 Transcript_46440/m.54266 type:complete len:127 (+) Transcript_46440:229-609(+)
MIASKLSLSSTTHPYLVEGCNTITTADISLFTTLSRFDEIYRIHYKTNSRIVARTPSLLRFMRRVFNIRGVSKTCNMNEMKVYYYRSGGSSDEISNKNNRIIPRGGEFMKLLEMGGGDKNDRIIDT